MKKMIDKNSIKFIYEYEEHYNAYKKVSLKMDLKTINQIRKVMNGTPSNDFPFMVKRQIQKDIPQSNE